MTARPIHELARDMQDTLHANTEMDTLERSRLRLAVIFAGFYDDEPDEPDQAIRDLLTDVMHEAEARGVGIYEAWERAGRMFRMERAEWAEREAAASTTKTPEQIAHEVMLQCRRRSWCSRFNFGPAGDIVIQMIRDAIEADRAQRDIVAQIAEILDARGADAAAALVRDTDPDDDLWNNYIGPMIDGIENDYTKIAADIREEN